MKTTRWVSLGLALAGALLASCAESSTTANSTTIGSPNPPTNQAYVPPIEPEGTRPEPGGPIAGLTYEQRNAFERGKAIFTKAFKPSEGLGPHYNATACRSCHSEPAIGGSSELYRNFYIAGVGFEGSQFPITGLPSIVVPAFGKGQDFTTERGRAVIPDAFGPLPVTVTQRNAPPIFGTGLFEFISNATISANADPNDLDGDGISGRFNTDATGMGRFGYKAQSNNIELFTRAPLQNQMGITTDPFEGEAGEVSLSMRQATQGPNLPSRDEDMVTDPELGRQDLSDLLAFQRFLAPVQKKLPFNAAAERGEVLFDQVGCTACHIPSLPSSRGPVEAYTDLLIHDMGPDLADGISLGTPQAAVGDPDTNGHEWRTQPLWGVSLHAPYLHDGRAETLEEAIEAHGGEAQAIRDAFVGLSQDDKNDLIAFLEHL